MIIILFIMSLILALRIVYLYATGEFEKILQRVILNEKNTPADNFFTLFEIMFIVFALFAGDNNIRFLVYIYIAHNIFFAILIHADKMLKEKPWRLLFLGINWFIFVFLSIQYGYKIWIGIL